MNLTGARALIVADGARMVPAVAALRFPPPCGDGTQRPSEVQQAAAGRGVERPWWGVAKW